MAWTVEISDVAERQLRKLDRPIQEMILDWLTDRIEVCKNPRHFGEPLKGKATAPVSGGIESVITGSFAISRTIVWLSWSWLSAIAASFTDGDDHAPYPALFES